MLESHQVSRRFVCQTAVLAILFFIAVAPTATMLQFCRTPENLVIAAALECKRDGHWLMPTLEGELRTAKPPLPTWITAASMTTSTVNQMSDPDPAKRFEAAKWLAWETRWPAIVIATITLIATAELSRLLLGSEWLGLASMMLLASGFLYLRFATEAATDSSLMLWVTVANVFLVRAIYFNQRWVGCIGAGTALGLAFMCKGPVAFIETIVPIVVLAAWKRPAVSASLREWAAPVLIGVACGLLIALPWPIAVLMQNPAKQAEFWIKQISGQDAPTRHDPIWNYPLRLTTGVLPSFVLLYAGIVRGWRTRTTGALAAIIFLLVPVLILTCFKDRKDRYLLPMMPAAAIVSAIALSRANRLDWPKIWQWIIVTIVAVGLPIAGATRGLRGVDGQPWLTPALARRPRARQP